jgi:hypothetical protein
MNMTNALRCLFLVGTLSACASDVDAPVECSHERWLVIARASAPGCPERAAEVVACGWQPDAGELTWQGASAGGAADGTVVDGACSYMVWLEPVGPAQVTP